MEEEIACDDGYSDHVGQPDRLGEFSILPLTVQESLQYDITFLKICLEVLKRSDSSVNRGCIPSDDISVKYSMNFKEKSLCYIFNHMEYFYKLDLKDRKYAEMDCNRIKECFERLNFEVHIFTDLPACEIKHELKCVSKEDHSNRAAFICFFLTHGDEEGMLHAFDTKYPVKRVLEYFSRDNPSLNGKPKLFFIQACRGHNADSGISVKKKEYVDGVTDSWYWSKIPGLSDFFIGYSTIEGHVAFGNKKGSVFMQTLCKYIDKYAADMDLLHIMTYVNQEVAEFESRSKKSSRDQKKQIPCIWFTLTKLFKFSVMHLKSS